MPPSVQGKVTNRTNGHQVFLSIILWNPVGMMNIQSLDHPLGARELRGILTGANTLLTAATALPVSSFFNGSREFFPIGWIALVVNGHSLFAFYVAAPSNPSNHTSVNA